MADRLSEVSVGEGLKAVEGPRVAVGREEEEDRVKVTPNNVVYRSYSQRWAILLVVVILNISNASLWINTAPIAYKAADYFKVSVSDINWFSLVFMVVCIPFSFVTTFTVNLIGLGPVIHIGSALNCLGALMRAVSTSGLFPNLEAQFIVSMTGQVPAAIAQTFLLFIPTKVSQIWFPEDGRVISTTFLSLASPLGMMVAQIASPLLVQEKSQLPTLNYVFGGVAVFCQLATLVCINRSKPPTPPSQSAEMGERSRAPYLQQLKETFTSLPYILLLLSIGCGVGLVTGISTVTQQMLCPLGYSDMFSGLINALMILFGFVGSAITGILADRTKAFTPITLLFYGIATLFGIVMMEMFMVPGQPVVLAIATCLFGFFGFGTYPIGLELAVETTYPVEETISSAYIFVSGQVLGLVVISMVTLLARDLKPQYVDIEVCTKGLETDILPKDYTVSLMAIMALLTFTTCLALLFFDTRYKRLEADRASRSLISSSSSSSHSLSVISDDASGGWRTETMEDNDSNTSHL